MGLGILLVQLPLKVANSPPRRAWRNALPDNRDANINHLIRKTKSQLLTLTLHQLRDYVALCHAKTQERAAQLLSRDPSNVRGSKQAVERALRERAFSDVRKRGGELTVTPAGNVFQKHAERILLDVFELTQEVLKPRRVRLALTNYMTELPIVRKVLQQAQTNLKSGLILSHIASHEVESALLQGLSDFVFAATLSTNGEARSLDRAIQFQPFKETYRVGLLSNYPVSGRTPEVLQLTPVEQQTLLPPTHGIYLEVLNSFLTPSERENLSGLQSDDIHFALDVLRYGQKACIIVDENLATMTMKRSPGKQLSFRPFKNARIHIGAFRRKDMGILTKPSQPNSASIRHHALQAFEEILMKCVGT